MIFAYEIERIYFEIFNFVFFVKKIMIIVQIKQFIEKQLACTNAAENAKKLKFNQNHQSVLKKVISIKKCKKNDW